MVKELLEDQNFRDREEYYQNALASATGSRREWYRKGMTSALVDAGFLIKGNPSRKFTYMRERLHSFFNSAIERMAHETLDEKARPPWSW